jgi:hypothetical protein
LMDAKAEKGSLTPGLSQGERDGSAAKEPAPKDFNKVKVEK